MSDIDEDIRLLLACGDGDGDVLDGFTLIEQHLRDPVCGWVRLRKCPGISAEEMNDLWDETLVELLKQVRGGKYKGERKVFTDLCQIIKTNSIDRGRRKKSREDLAVAFGRTLQDTDTGQRWKGMQPAERRELQRLIQAAVATLPLKQRQVMEAFVANFPESRDMQKLRQSTGELTGTEETLASVKRALQEGRVKVRAVLRRKGYDHTQPGGDGDE